MRTKQFTGYLSVGDGTELEFDMLAQSDGWVKCTVIEAHLDRMDEICIETGTHYNPGFWVYIGEMNHPEIAEWLESLKN